MTRANSAATKKPFSSTKKIASAMPTGPLSSNEKGGPLARANVDAARLGSAISAAFKSVDSEIDGNGP